MDGNIVSAGSFAAAVLETMGYVTQSHFLEDFRSFFRDAGSLIYFIALVSALLSYVLYGSARAVRYLIIGPALFWYLVGPTTVIQGAVSKLGAGPARGTLNKTGLEAAKSDVSKVAGKAGTDIGEIKVATAFWLFAKPINDITEHLVGVFLNNGNAGDGGDQLDRQMGDRVRGLELISRMIPEDEGMIHRLEDGILRHCSKSYHAALGAAESYIKDRSRAGISTKTRQAPMTRYLELNKTKVAEFNRVVAEEMLPTKDTRFAEYIEQVQSKSKVAKQAVGEDGKAIASIHCTLAWDIFLEELWARSATSIPDSIILTSGDWSDPLAVKRACQELSRKLYEDGATDKSPCNLTPGIALATLFNHTSRSDTFGRVLSRHSTYKDPLNPGTNQGAVSAIGTAFDIVGDRSGNPIVKMAHTAVGLTKHVLVNELRYGDKDGAVRKIAEWAPLVQLHAINGIDHATYISMPAYQLTRIRQDLYTWAMQLPYYQGVLLYFIALAYPFLALLVLIPGKAQNVLFLPMAWMWIKSWDVGIAVVILLERVMYNILPNWALPKTLQEGPWTWDKLPTVLGEGYNFSHVTGIAQHYTVLSMALLAVPPLTGALFLKGKKAILGNFTSAIENQGRDAGQRAASRHSIATASERSQMMQKIRGVAVQLPRLQAGGLGGGLRGFGASGRAAFTELMKGEELAKALKGNGAAGIGGGFSGKMAEIAANAPESFIQNSAKNIANEVAYESAMRESFDPIFGRWGSLQMFNDAYSSALDGAGASMEGGFETNQPKTNPIDQMAEMYKSRIGDMVNMREAIGRAEGAILGNMSNSDNAALSLVGNGVVALDQLGVGEYDKSLGRSLSWLSEQKSGAYEAVLGTASNAVIQNLGPAGYSSEEARDRLFMTGAGMGNSDEVKNAYKAVNEEYKGTATGAMFSAFFGSAMGENVSPGGPSSFGDHVRGFSGNRIVEDMSANEVPSGQFLGPYRPDLLSSGRYENLAPNLSEAGANISNFILNNNLSYNPEVEYRNGQIKAEHDLRISNPLVHKEELRERYGELSRTLNGMGIPGPTINEADPSTFAPVLVEWALKLNEENKAMPGASVRKQDFLSEDLNRVAKSAPGLAIQEITEWISRQAGHTGSNTAYGYPAGKIITDPDNL